MSVCVCVFVSTGRTSPVWNAAACLPLPPPAAGPPPVVLVGADVVAAAVGPSRALLTLDDAALDAEPV